MLRTILRASAAAFLIIALAGTANAQWTEAGGVLIRGTIVTMDDAGTVTQGSILVKNGKIAQILPANAPVPAGAIEIDTKGAAIFPGLINLHNHIAYNFLPLYPVPKAYGNRDQWPKGAAYETLVNNPKNLLTQPGHYNVQTEVLKYAEIKALMGGETTIQGSPSDGGSGTILVRNIETKNFPGHKSSEDVLGPDERLATEEQRTKWLTNDAGFIHLAEGVDDHAEKEYKTWKAIFGKAFTKFVGIHSTGLTEADFADWEASVGNPKVVWSPLSNLMLYGGTTNIPAALKHKAIVALGTDWSPSGSKSLIWELKVADQVNKSKFNGLLKDYDLVALATRNAAKLLNRTDCVGQLKVGMTADLVVVDLTNKTNAYRNLIDGVEQNVQMVMVGGDPIYGDESVLAKLKKKDGKPTYEVLKESPAGRPKALDLKRNVPQGQQSVEDIKKALTDAANLDPKDLANVLNAGNPDKIPAEKFKPRDDMRKWLAGHHGHPLAAGSPTTVDEVKEYLHLRYPNAKPVTIDPIYEQNDDGYWKALSQNLFLKNKAIFDVDALMKYRTAQTAGINAAVPH